MYIQESIAYNGSCSSLLALSNIQLYFSNNWIPKQAVFQFIENSLLNLSSSAVEGQDTCLSYCSQVSLIHLFFYQFNIYLSPLLSYDENSFTTWMSVLSNILLLHSPSIINDTKCSFNSSYLSLKPVIHPRELNEIDSIDYVLSLSISIYPLFHSFLKVSSWNTSISIDSPIIFIHNSIQSFSVNMEDTTDGSSCVTYNTKTLNYDLSQQHCYFKSQYCHCNFTSSSSTTMMILFLSQTQPLSSNPLASPLLYLLFLLLLIPICFVILGLGCCFVLMMSIVIKLKKRKHSKTYDLYCSSDPDLFTRSNDAENLIDVTEEFDDFEYPRRRSMFD
mmetsp:Transcript_5543/g.8186  ORF Transcript_5543/g.8186 Transcript_5543/m.8186 type:complete len:333 (-) Transcript_5543:81-1079(-)